ncbi:hypothetical protein QBC42DRAFT_276960 [Cladorrhinum samala]|uniref:Uncharacterized protein n=1 Tax=Cladorrhinum samala TaxID=585594 RepID=A0AAV9HE24_9PEZI|nr:hypothetical protein QBC42DRAFT_276960 [Cladorrhinum samala]
MRAFFYRVFEEFASNPGGVTIVINICETLFEAGADPNKQMAVPPNENQRPIGNAGPFLRNKTPWTFLAAMLLGDYIGFLRTAKLRPNFALWEAVIKVFVNKGARTDAIVNAQGFLLEGPPSQLWHPRPLSNQLEVFVFRNTRSADPRLEILMDSARRIQHYLESPPETTNLNTDPRASSSKEPKEGGNLALQATQAGDVETGHSPESNACELGHEQPLDRSAWLHDTLRLLLCCNGTRRG